MAICSCLDRWWDLHAGIWSQDDACKKYQLSGTYYNLTNLFIDFKLLYAWHCWKDGWYFINGVRTTFLRYFHSKESLLPSSLGFFLFVYNILSSSFIPSIYAASIIYLYILMHLPDKLLLHFCESCFFFLKSIAKWFLQRIVFPPQFHYTYFPFIIYDWLCWYFLYLVGHRSIQLLSRVLH